MRNPCLLLVKNRLLAQTGISVLRYEKDKSRRRRKQALCCVYIVVFFLIAIYSGAYAYALAEFDLEALIPIFAFALCSIITFFYSAFFANSELFSYSDFDLLMSLPLKTSTMITARFLNMYIWNTLFTALVMIPMGIVYSFSIDAGFHLQFWFFWLTGIFVICLIPTTFATMIGGVIAAVAARCRHSGAVSSLILLIFTCVILFLPFFFTGNGEAWNSKDIIFLLNGCAEKMMYIYPPTQLFLRTIWGNSLLSGLLLWIISLGWYLLFLAVMTKNYKKIRTRISSHHAAGNYRMQEQYQSSPIYALYRKELRRWLGSSVYLTNTVVGAVLAIAIGIAIAFFKIPLLTAIGNWGTVSAAAEKLGPFILALCLSMSCTTGSSISLEGKNLWLLQSLPIPVKTIFHSKLLVNFTLVIPAAVLSAALFAGGIKPGFLGTCIYFVVPFSFAVVGAVWGLWLNFKLPNYQWESDTEVVKQSVCSLLSWAPLMLLAILCGIAALFTSWDYRLIALGASAILWLWGILLYLQLMKVKKL